MSLRWRHNERDTVSNHQPHDCLLNRLFRRRSKKTAKLRVTGLCEGNSPGTGEFPTQMASYAENASIWWRHHILSTFPFMHFCSISIIRTKVWRMIRCGQRKIWAADMRRHSCLSIPKYQWFFSTTSKKSHEKLCCIIGILCGKSTVSSRHAQSV